MKRLPGLGADRREIADLRDLTFGKNGELLAACRPRQGRVGGLARVWDLRANTGLNINGPVERLALSRDGRFLALRSRQRIDHFDLTERKVVRRFPLKGGPPGPLAYRPDGKQLAAAVIPDGKQAALEVAVWDLTADKKPVTVGGHHDTILALAYSGDGTRLATAGNDRTIKVWDLLNEEEDALRLVGHVLPVTSLVFSPDGKRLISVSGDKVSGDVGRDGDLKIWDLQTGRELSSRSGQAIGFFHLAVSPDGKTLATGCGNGSVKFWDTDVPPEAASLPATNPVLAMTLSPDGKLLAYGCGQPDTLGEYDIRVCDARTLAERHRFRSVIGTVFQLAFSADSKRLAATASVRIGQTINFRPAILVWDLQTGEEVKKRGAWAEQRPSGDNSPLLLSPDGKRVLCEQKLWDIAGDKMILDLTARGFLASAAFTRDGRRLVLCYDSGLRVLDARTGEELRAFKQWAGFPYIALSPDNKWIAFPSARGPVVWDLDSDKPVVEIKAGPYRTEITSVAFTPDGKRLVCGSRGGSLSIYELVGGMEVLTIPAHRLGCNFLAFTPDGKRLFTGGHDGTVKVWDAPFRHPITVFKRRWGGVEGLRSPLGPVDPVLLDSAGRFLIAAENNTIRLWDARTGKERPALEGHKSEVEALAADRTGRRWASASQKRWVEYADKQNGPRLLVMGRLDTGPDSKQLFRRFGEQVIKIWDFDKGKPLLELYADGARKLSLAFHPDGRRLAAACRREIRLWDVETGKLLRVFQGHKQDVTAVAFSPDGRLLLSGAWQEAGGPGDGSEVKLWDAESGKEIASLLGAAGRVRGVAFSPDGRRAAAALGDAPGKKRPGEVKLWDVDTGKEVRTLSGHAEAVTAVAFSPDGKHILTGSQDYTLKLWDAVSGKELKTLTGHLERVSDVAFARDGRRIASAGRNQVKLWDAELWRPE